MPAGRPTVMNKDTIAKLEHAFSANCNKTEACLYAGISHDSLDRYITKNPEFSVRIKQLRSNPRMMAKLNTLDKISGGCQKTSEFVLTHTDPEYKPKTDISGEVALSPAADFLEALRQSREE